MRNRLIRLLFIVALIYASILAYMYINQRNLQYHPSKDISDLSTYDLGDTKEVFLTSSDGAKIQTWVHMPKIGMPMVIWYSGNSYNLAHKTDRFRKLIEMGYGFIAPSWHGFGKSEGSPGKDELYGDAKAAINYLLQLGFKTEDTILIGESLGSGIATQMATENKFKGLFLITPYTSIADRGQEIYWYLPVKYFVKDNYNNIENIERINTPLLIVHGDHDEVVPHSHSEKLLEKALEPKKLIIYPGKHHNDLDSNSIFAEMDRFLNKRDIENNDTTLKE